VTNSLNIDAITTIAGIGLLTAIAQWTAWWIRLPAILFLLVFGILAGPVLDWLRPDELFGDLLFPIISLSVAVILFEGSLTLKISELKEVGSTVRNLVTIGAAITWGITSFLVYKLIGFDLKLSILFGAVVVVTGPTVIVPMLRTVRPNRKISDILRWEGIVIDPLGALFAVLAFNFYISSQSGQFLETIFQIFFFMVFAGVSLGVIAGIGLGFLFKHHLVPEYLRSPITLLLVFVVFALSELVAHESGLLAVTIFGMVLANQKDLDVADILDFKESLSIVLIGGLFVILAARLDVQALLSIGYEALLLLAGVMFIARPISVFVSSIGSGLSIQEKLLLSWIGPRGIVCAAVAAAFAIRLVDIDARGADMFVPLAFLIIIGTVSIQGISAKYVAHWLGVRDPVPSGFLIIGGGRVGRLIAKALHDQDIRVLIADSDWENISQARMEGLETYYGNPISEHADRHMSLSGIGKLICISGRSNFDVVASLHFKGIFGAQNAYELPMKLEKNASNKHLVSRRLRGHNLFGNDVTYNKLLSWILSGASIKVTKLSDEFGFERYAEQFKDGFIAMFILSESGKLEVISENTDIKPHSGSRIISLVRPS
jgi:NhaP-type Na+/H+ or K+/H+ antiporter